MKRYNDTRQDHEAMHNNLRVSHLTTCDVIEGGRTIRLQMLDNAGEKIVLEVPAELASSLLLTLPQLMNQCLQQLRGDGARLVFPIDQWTLESAVEAEAFILTLKTVDGFGAAFALNLEDAQALAKSLDTYCSPTERRLSSRTLN